MVKLALHNVKTFLPLTGLDFTGAWVVEMYSNILKLSESKQNNSLPFPVPLCVVLELPVTSPLANAVLKTLENWEQILLEKINKFDGPPPNYINTYPTDLSAGGGPAILRHKAMLEPDNTPFKWVFDLDVTIKPKTYWIFKKDVCVYTTVLFIFFSSGQSTASPSLLAVCGIFWSNRRCSRRLWFDTSSQRKGSRVR